MTLAQSQRQSSVAVVVFYLQRCSFLRKTKRQTLICVIDDQGQPILLHCSRKIRSVLTIKKSLQLFFIFSRSAGRAQTDWEGELVGEN